MKKIIGSPIDTIEDLPEEEEKIKINCKEHFSENTWFLNPAAVAHKLSMLLDNNLQGMGFVCLLILLFFAYTGIAIGSVCFIARALEDLFDEYLPKSVGVVNED